jgi:uncharacterized protein (TIGR02996 family)
MDMHSSFLADIAANPEDDAPRLVYADWLDDNGDPDRAAFIRAQCRLARMGPCNPERFALEADAEDLLAKHGKKWLKLPKVGARVEWARGFPHRLAFPVAKFLTQGDAVLAAAPTWREYRPLQHATGWEDFIRSPLLGRMTTLDVGYARIGVARAISLMASPLIAGLRSLNISGSGLRARGADAVISSPHVANLRRLDLRGNDAGDAAIQRLAASANFPNLVSLDIRDNRLTPPGFRGLAHSPLARRLEDLAIDEERGDDEIARAFAEGDWHSLRKLSFALGRRTADAIAALATCSSLSGLRELEVRSNAGQPVGPLFASPHLTGLERLVLLSHGATGPLEALAASPMLGNLRGLVVQGGDAGMGAVLDSPASAGLVELHFSASNEEVLVGVARRFAEAGHLTNLRKLTFGQSNRKTPWVTDLVGAPALANVVDLDLKATYTMDEPALQALIASPYLVNLRRLRLHSYPFGQHRRLRPALEERFGSALKIG